MPKLCKAYHKSLVNFTDYLLTLDRLTVCVPLTGLGEGGFGVSGWDGILSILIT